MRIVGPIKLNSLTILYSLERHAPITFAKRRHLDLVYVKSKYIHHIIQSHTFIDVVYVMHDGGWFYSILQVFCLSSLH